MDKKEKCGVFGVWGRSDAAELSYFATYAQQHRGQESAGIAVTDHEKIDCHVGMGLVTDAISQEQLSKLTGTAAIGHNRYSTTGESRSTNAQPLLQEFSGGQIAIAHNGNLANASLLRHQFEERGHLFHTSTDTEVIFHLLAAPEHASKKDPLYHALQHLQGAYSLVLLYKDRIEAVRDPWGFRPLSLGQLPDGAYCVASETVALDSIGATTIREIEPGEIITIDATGVSSRRFSKPRNSAHCIFEHIYFANPSSRLFGDTVQLVRERLGEQLAIESHVDADLVMPMPDSGRSAALGYARQSGLPFREGIVPNRYVGRTFIQPTQAQRQRAVSLKLNVIEEVVRDQRVIVVDDSMIRGTTTKGKISQLRRAGAKEIHFRVSCPAVRHPCHFGIDFPDEKELVANQRTLQQITEFIGVDTLGYLSEEGMIASVSKEADQYCAACFNGDYPIDVEHPTSKIQLERYQMNMFK